MSKIVDLQFYMREREFENDVVPFVLSINPAFQYFKHENEAVFFFNYRMHVFIFLRYIPNGFDTHFPSLYDAMDGMKRKYRTSQGEWVVEKTSELTSDKTIPLYNLLYSKTKKDDFVQELKSRLKTLDSGS